MCHRMSPLQAAEMREALRALRESGRARVPAAGAPAASDAYPGSQVPLFVPDAAGALEVATLSWGFDSPASRGLVFNTRIETALAQARAGRGLWARAASEGRCLVPVRCFYESADAGAAAQGEKDPRSEWAAGAPARARRPQWRFRLAGHAVFLLACVADGGRFSVVTCPPNGDVAPVHRRMPLVLAPGESAVWLGPDYASLADRSRVRLDAEPAEDARA
ncbi:SOS response-associated peptidase family protein [Olsenella sp. YH-ols2223]|uniref:SOS response-associated peptidase family protein n=1 Tax=Olsenella absiana TaxID=3115222 RepID=A0ABU7R7B1_9ACTN